MFCCNRRWIAKNGINDCGIKYFASHMQCRKNCNFKEIVLSQLLKSDAVLFLRRSTGPNVWEGGQATSTDLHWKGNGKRIFSKLAVSVSYVSRRIKGVNGHVPFRRSLRSVKYAKRFQRGTSNSCLVKTGLKDNVPGLGDIHCFNWK